MGPPPLLCLSLLLFISSSLSNPITLERAIALKEEPEAGVPDIITEQSSSPLKCENPEADRCLLFPIGCVPDVTCTDKLEIARVKSGSNTGDILVSLHLHVPRTAHMLVAVPMPDAANPNATFLVGCSIDENIAVVARPDVDGVTDQLEMSWLRLVAIQATAQDIDCVVSASAGYIDLPIGDIAVFAGELEQEEVRQSHRISGSLDSQLLEDPLERAEREEEREEEKEMSREPIKMDSGIAEVQAPPHLATHPKAVPALEHTEDSEPVLVQEEKKETEATEEKSTTAASTTVKPNRLRFKPFHTESAERETSTAVPHATHRTVHHAKLATVAPSTPATKINVKENTFATASTRDSSEVTDESHSSTTVHPPHHVTHHHHHTTTHHPIKHHVSHEHHHAATVEPSLPTAAPLTSTRRMTSPPVTTTVMPSRDTQEEEEFEKNEEISEEEKDILRLVSQGAMRAEGEQSEEVEDEDYAGEGQQAKRKYLATSDLSREVAIDPIGRRPSEHEHHHTSKPVSSDERHSSSHSHSSSHAVTHHTTTPANTHRHNSHGSHEKHHSTTTKEMERKHEGKHSHPHDRSLYDEEDEDEIMGEKKQLRRNKDRRGEGEDEDDAASTLSLIVPLMVCLAPVIFGL